MGNKKKAGVILGLLLSFSLIAAACGGDDDDASSDTTAEEGSANANSLVGMRGTLPLLELGDDFKERLLKIDPALVDYNYSAESYDATIISALAAEEAKTDGSDYASKINGMTRDGEKCTDWKSCLAIVKAGGDVDYDGQAGELEFSGNGEPTKASYGVQQFGTTGCDKLKVPQTECIDDAKTKYVPATAPAEADVPPVPVEASRPGDGTFTVGTLLPKTGSLAFLGPPEFAGVKLAIEEINAGGGVLGKPVAYIEGDSGDTDNKVAPGTVDTLLSQNADVIVGAASSSVTLSVIDKITTAGVTMFSPANTSKKLSTYADKGLYFRDAPSDILQGGVLADTITGDNHSNVFVLALNDDYGTGLADDFQKAFEEGGGKVVGKKVYDPKAADYAPEVEAAKAADPDAVLLIGFDESSRILAKMVEQGIGPSQLPVYGVDGNMGNALAKNFEDGK